MARKEKCILTNMCMICDHHGNVLVQDRKNPDWPGITFPGGHIEKGESFVESVIREVKEETGLDVSNLKLCGVKQFTDKKEDYRYIVFLYKTNTFKGNLQSSNEGEVFWIKRENLFTYKTCEDFDQMVEIFEREDLSENYYFYTDKWNCKNL